MKGAWRCSVLPNIEVIGALNFRIFVSVCLELLDALFTTTTIEALGLGQSTSSIKGEPVLRFKPSCSHSFFFPAAAPSSLSFLVPNFTVAKLTDFCCIIKQDGQKRMASASFFIFLTSPCLLMQSFSRRQPFFSQKEHRAAVVQG